MWEMCSSAESDLENMWKMVFDNLFVFEALNGFGYVIIVRKWSEAC